MRFIRDLVLVGLVTAVTLLLLEGLLRLSGVHFNGSLFTQEAARGYALRPQAEGWSTEENEIYVHINSDGMRDVERSVATEPGTIRVAVIGSSDAEATQVPLDQTFEALMERNLSHAAGHKVEVLNFGVAGYDSAQMYLTVRDHVWKYRPQVVIVTLSTYGVLNNTRALYSLNEDSPFFVYQNGKLVPDAATLARPAPDPRSLQRKNIASDWMNRSRLLSLANASRLGIRRWLGTLRSTSRKSASRGGLPADYTQTWEYLDPDDPAQPVDPRLRQAWEINDGLLRLMRDESVQHGAEFWILVSPLGMQIHPDLAVREKFRSQLGIASLHEADHRLERFAQSEGMHILVLAPIMADYAATHQQALCGFWNTPFNAGHLNEDGHRIAAAAISDALLQESAAFRSTQANVTSLKAPTAFRKDRP